MYVKLFEDFENFINESILSNHYIERVSQRIQNLKIFSLGEYKKNPAVALERCKKVLMAKLKILEKKSYVGDSYYWVESFGDITLKDSKGSYKATFSTDNGKFKGTVFVAIVYNNLLLTAYLINGDKTDEQIKEMVEKHSNELYPEYEQQHRGVKQDWLGNKKTIIDMDMSDEAFEILINPAPAEKITLMTKQVKEMAVTKGNEVIIMTKENGQEVYKKKTIDTITILNTKTMFLTFTDGKSKNLVIDGDKLNKKFIITPAKASDNKYYIGNITEFGVNKGKYFLKIQVSQTLDDIELNTPL